MALKSNVKQKANFSKVVISLASPETILRRSSGEVLKPETINYRTYKPERDGLFCEKIFGPIKDYECHCGKYKRIRYKGIVCDRCGVEVTEKKVRRERVGHINLVVPVVHIWYFKSLPNKIGYLLGLNAKKLESIIYYEKYVVIQPGAAANIPIADKSGVEYLDFLSEEEYYHIIEQLPKENQMLDDKDPNKFIAKMGAEAIRDLLARIDLDTLSFELRDKASKETSQQRKQEALKRLQVIESFRQANQRMENKPDWMVIKVLPVIPPELRPLVPLDGGRFATADLNDLYRRVIIRNNRLKRLIEIKAPDVILRNEKRMLQEAVDALFDNSRKTTAVKTDNNRPLKSLSDALKGKQGRFRQNLLGKRVDYSGRSVIVVGPELKLHECGLPKDMAAELFKPFIIRRLIERGVVKTVKSAKKVVERKDPVIWDILENILKGHPVLLNRAPTLHRLGIQAFQPKLIEGKAIQLHPLVCTAFNADFDGDQMAVHVPLSNAAIVEAQLLMLSSHNILNPSNGTPIALPSQDMVLGLYYLTKERAGTKEVKIKGEGKVFYNAEEVEVAYNEGKVDLHAKIKVKIDNALENGELKTKLIDTTVGRVIFNQRVPKEVGYINELLTKKSLRDIIANVLKKVGMSKTAQFLDDIKELGFMTAFRGGLSFTLSDITTPEKKKEIVEEVIANYNMGFITSKERYNQIIDIWTHANVKITKTIIEALKSDRQGFNPVYMMLDSGARGSNEQIKQLSGWRGLMAKPQKSGSTSSEFIENPIISNFREGLTVHEYFISTHGARKGLADTALKTADAGYLTRRLVDVAQDVIITENDCGTLRGITMTALKEKDDVIESLYDRILGRFSLNDVYHPHTGELIVGEGELINEEVAKKISESPIESVEIRSVLTCESKVGVCAKCYGRNLGNGRMVQLGEAVGVIAAQSIGEPGTQLTLRTFHAGGTASVMMQENTLKAKYEGVVEIDDIKTVETEDLTGEKVNVVIGRSTELRVIDTNTGIAVFTGNVPYGSILRVKNGQKVKKDQLLCEWDPYNAVIVAEFSGKVEYENIIENITYHEEVDENTGFRDKVIIDSKDKSINPVIKIIDSAGNELKKYNIPVGAHIIVNNNEKIKAGKTLVKIPRISAKSGDITGGLPRVTELFEARNPSDPAVISEIDGYIVFGRTKRGSREVIVESKTGERKIYLIPLTKHILVQENDYVKAGDPLCDGAISLNDILNIKGPTAVQEYIVNEIQEVYRRQGQKLNDKHFEVIVRQMMRKVEIVDPGDTNFLEQQIVSKLEFMEENDRIYGNKVVIDAGDSGEVKRGQIISARKLREINSILKRRDMKTIEARDAQPATAKPILQGITKASLQTSSWISAASFQETTKVLNEAAISAKEDHLLGLKENVIVGHLIPAGTGLRKYEKLILTPENSEHIEVSKEEVREEARVK